MTAMVDEHICRLDVQVKHTVFVRVGKRLAQGVGDVRLFVVRERVAVDLREKLLK